MMNIDQMWCKIADLEARLEQRDKELAELQKSIEKLTDKNAKLKYVIAEMSDMYEFVENADRVVKKYMGDEI